MFIEFDGNFFVQDKSGEVVFHKTEDDMLGWLESNKRFLGPIVMHKEVEGKTAYTYGRLVSPNGAESLKNSPSYTPQSIYKYF